eukprot:6512947-Prymnesium_polylepis.1
MTHGRHNSDGRCAPAMCRPCDPTRTPPERPVVIAAASPPGRHVLRHAGRRLQLCHLTLQRHRALPERNE